MARPPFNPSPEQAAALASIVRAKRTRAEGYDRAEAKVREQIAAEKAELDRLYAQAIRNAYQTGLSKNYLGVHGMGTSDPHTINRWLARTEGESIYDAMDVFAWADRQAGTVAISFPSYPTSATDPVDYPEVLAGVVRRDPTAKNGWTVQLDPGDTKHGNNVLSGWLTWEIQDVPATHEQSLVALLNEWADR